MSDASIPACPNCEDRTWTGTYRAQVERTWSVSGAKPAPNLDSEDEDSGEWDVPSCSSYGEIAGDALRDLVMDRLLASG